MDSSEKTGQWLDFHVLLNALAVVGSRVRERHPTSSDLLDSITGYLTTSLELQRNGSVDSIEQFRDWLHCLTELRNTTQRTQHRCEVHTAEGDMDSDAAVQLDGLRELVGRAETILQTVGSRSDPLLLRVQVVPGGISVSVLRDAAGNSATLWHQELAGNPFGTP